VGVVPKKTPNITLRTASPLSYATVMGSNPFIIAWYFELVQFRAQVLLSQICPLKGLQVALQSQAGMCYHMHHFVQTAGRQGTNCKIPYETGRGWQENRNIYAVLRRDQLGSHVSKTYIRPIHSLCNNYRLGYSYCNFITSAVSHRAEVNDSACTCLNNLVTR
jgi:hypothetical protein